MLEDIGPRLKTGAVVHTVTVRGLGLREGEIAEDLGALDSAMPDVSIGSYPWFVSIKDSGVHLVARTLREDLLDEIEGKLSEIVRKYGAVPERVTSA
mgnify:CR=1 FL=1